MLYIYYLFIYLTFKISRHRQTFVKIYASYWVKHLNENTNSNTQDVIIFDEMNLLSATTLKPTHRYVFVYSKTNKKIHLIKNSKNKYHSI